MSPERPPRHVLPAACALVALAAVSVTCGGSAETSGGVTAGGMAAGAVAAATTAASAAALEMVCKANYDFCVEVNGAYPPDARFFVADARGKFLVDIPSQAQSVLIDLPTKKAVSVPRASIKQEATEGTVRVPDPGASATPAYALSIEGPVLRFHTDDSQVRVLKVTERPPLVGTTTLEALVADRPEYREGIKAYKPDAVAIESLKKSRKPVEIEAFFGTWCQHCKVYMPKFLRVMQDASNPNIKLSLVGVPKGFGTEPGPWQGKGFQAIPTIMVRYEGREVTRLGSHEGAIPEVELAGIIAAIK
jgi:thiol-disulfide isomerase/thioredoxin